MPDSPPPLADRVLAGRYRLVGRLAQGGMAEVWEGHDQVLARPVAIKVLHHHLASDDAFIERFRREAVAAARLVHPAIVATYDAGTDDGIAFIVMELVRGQTLRQALAESGPLPTTVAVPIAAQVADALDHAHRAGLVHRDVKPANILVTEQEGTTTTVSVKVADFGIARLETEEGAMALTQTGAVVGTAAYLAPEQVTGDPPDGRSDGYALGVVLYEMLCGQAPFRADTDLATALLHVRQAPPSPRVLRPTVPPPLERIVLTALAKQPDERYQSLGAFRDALLGLDLTTLDRADVDRAEDAEDEQPEDEPTGELDAPVDGDRRATPPRGTLPLPRPAERRRGPLAGILALAALALVVVGLLVAGGGSGGGGDGGGPGASPTARGTPVAVTGARSFDPLGDGEENDARTSLAVDGNPSTSWSTQTYRSRPFGGLKSGVGLVIELDRASALRTLDVRSPTQGWAAEVYVAARPGAVLGDWGRPVATIEGASGDASVDLDDVQGGAVLVWITDTGPSLRVEISEVVVRS